jgi:phosphate transport system substrate-binding protein
MVGIKSSVRVACALATMLLFHNQVVAGQSLRVGGTGATNEMVKSLGPVLLAETGIVLQLIPSLGTVGGNSAVADGIIDLCISGRPLNPAETARGLIAVAEFRTPFGLVTSHPNPNGLKSAEIAQLYRSNGPVWADGTPMRIILRPTIESDTWVLGHMFSGMEAAIAKARDRAELPVAATDQDNAEMAEEIPGSLVAATLTQITMEKRKLRLVTIDGVEPSLENYENGTYPYAKSLYFVLTAQKSPAGERFLAFLGLPKGEAALREAGVLLSVR